MIDSPDGDLSILQKAIHWLSYPALAVAAFFARRVIHHNDKIVETQHTHELKLTNLEASFPYIKDSIRSLEDRFCGVESKIDFLIEQYSDRRIRSPKNRSNIKV